MSNSLRGVIELDSAALGLAIAEQLLGGLEDPKARGRLLDFAEELLLRPRTQEALARMLRGTPAPQPLEAPGTLVSRSEVLRALKISDSTLGRRLRDTPELARLERREAGGRPKYEWPEFQRRWNQLCR